MLATMQTCIAAAAAQPAIGAPVKGRFGCAGLADRAAGRAKKTERVQARNWTAWRGVLAAIA